MVKVSVVIPAYNGERFIGAALESVLAQSSPPHEIIVIDDGSTDRTKAIAESYGAPVKVISQNNGGVGAARTTGTRLASGDWIALLDQDDVFLPDKLERQIRLIEKDERLVVVYSGFRLLTQAGIGDETGAFPSGELWPALRYRSPILPSTALIRRSALECIGYFDSRLRMSDDWHCWIRLVRQYSPEGFGAVAEPLVLYRIWEGNHSKRTLKMLREIEFVVTVAVNDLSLLPRVLWRRRVMGRHYYETSVDLRAQKEPGFFRYMVKSLLSWPAWGAVVPFRRYKVAMHMLLIDLPRQSLRRRPQTGSPAGN